MKKTKLYIIPLLAIVMLATSCRKDAPDLQSPDNRPVSTKKSYAYQFNAVWHGINNSYVFWDIDTVDWDAKYEQYYPKFEALDASSSVSDSVFLSLWRGVVGQLRDHHFYIEVCNFKSEGDLTNDAVNKEKGRFRIGGGSRNVKLREGYRGTDFDGQYAALANHAKLDTLLINTKGCNMRSALFSKSNGKKIAYFRLSGFHIEDVSGNNTDVAWRPMAYFFGVEWLKTSYGRADFTEKTGSQVSGYKKIGEAHGWINDDNVEGIILDLRGNGGGNADNLVFIGGSLTQSPTLYGYSKTKEGLGRLDYSAWTPYHILTPRNNMTTAKTIVVLADDNSASCAEITTQLIHSLPNGTFIGRQTCGATCPLLPGQFNKLLSGVFGNYSKYGYYCYTSNFNLVDANYKSLEGIGVVPDIKVDYEGKDGKDEQLDAAIEYLETGKVTK